MVGPGPHEAVAVIGAFGGIGQPVTEGLAQTGWRPVLAFDRPAMLPEQSSGVIVPLPIELSDADGIAPALQAGRRHAPRIGGLVVTAGIVDTTRSAALTKARWAEVLAVNLTGVFFAVQAALDWLADGGRVVLHGTREQLEGNQDVQEFYLGLSRKEGGSYRDVKHYRRRKRWLG